MKVIDPGHVYDLVWVDGRPEADGHPILDYANRLTFVKREGEKYPRNVGHHPGTQIQEVLRTLIDRLYYVNTQEPDVANAVVISNLREAIFTLECRAAKRHGRRFDLRLWADIEKHPVCLKCGHIGCIGGCH